MRWRRVLKSTAKWGSTAAAVVIAAAFFLSMSRYCVWSDDKPGKTTCVVLWCGAIWVWWGEAPPRSEMSLPPGVHVLNMPPLMRSPVPLTPRIGPEGMGTRVLLPFWMPFAAAAFPAALLWRADIRDRRRQRTGSCPRCGYDRRGLPADATCPECGMVHARG